MYRESLSIFNAVFCCFLLGYKYFTIVIFPFFVLFLNNLEELDLSNNQIDNIPEELEGIPSLKVLIFKKE